MAASPVVGVCWRGSGGSGGRGPWLRRLGLGLGRPAAGRRCRDGGISMWLALLSEGRRFRPGLADPRMARPLRPSIEPRRVLPSRVSPNGARARAAVGSPAAMAGRDGVTRGGGEARRAEATRRWLGNAPRRRFEGVTGSQTSVTESRGLTGDQGVKMPSRKGCRI